MLEISLPDFVTIDSYKLDDRGESNSVYRCNGSIHSSKSTFYIKVKKTNFSFLDNEFTLLNKLKSSSLQCPNPLWHVKNTSEEHIGLEEVDGIPLWEFIDPRRKGFDQSKVLPYLFKYGRTLGLIHKHKIDHPHQKRVKLYNDLELQRQMPERYNHIFKWLADNRTDISAYVLTHSDLNLANILFDKDEVSGVIDWELAGLGWKEYDLAWILRKRIAFTNNQEERKAILEGYMSVNTYDDNQLRWCEVLNYLHWIKWCSDSEDNNCIEYIKFAEDNIEQLVAGIT